MVKVLEQYDFNRIPMLGVVDETNSTPPSNPVQFQRWNDSNTGKPRIYIGSTWVDYTQDTNTAVSSASETVQGIVELATTAETTTGTDAVRAVTPAGLKAVVDTKAAASHTHSTGQITGLDTSLANGIRPATESQAGQIEIATPTEAISLGDTTRAITPSTLGVVLGDYSLINHIHGISDVNGLSGELANKAPLTHTHGGATETVSGFVELATVAESTTGTSTIHAVTPAGMKAKVDQAIAALVNGAPGALDALNELAAALGNDPNFATTVTNALGQKYEATSFGLEEISATTIRVKANNASYIEATNDGVGVTSGGLVLFNRVPQQMSGNIPAMATPNTWTSTSSLASKTPVPVQFYDLTTGENAILGYRWIFNSTLNNYAVEFRAASVVAANTYGYSYLATRGV